MSVFVFCPLAALGFYVVVSLLIDGVCRRFHPETALARGKHGRSASGNVSRFSLWGSFILNTSAAGLLLAAVLRLSELGLTSLYSMRLAGPTDALVFLLHVAFFMVLADANFYWVHRLVHANPRLYKRIHHEHHRERFPTVWHCQFQHPVDYLATTALPILWIPLLPIPLSYEAYFAALVFCHFTNIGGHCGFEVTHLPIARASLNGLAMWLDPQRGHIARVFNLVSHHDLHHQRPKENYSLYFTFWDTVCKTGSERFGKGTSDRQVSRFPSVGLPIPISANRIPDGPDGADLTHRGAAECDDERGIDLVRLST